MHFNFELILFYATLVTGLISLIDIFVFEPKRKAKQTDIAKEEEMPLIADYARSFFPILLIVFLLRSFLFEPFRIPSGSLEPTLLMGDFILVNKFDYGVRLPVLHTKVMNYHQPKRGDIMIFRWPPDTSFDFIKRVIGLPGDRISYIHKQLYINGQKAPQIYLQDNTVGTEMGREREVKKMQENLLGINHLIYIDPSRSSRDFKDIVVPQGMYFVMGDNRDDSEDSRYWGFVPEKNVVGKAVMIWMSWDKSNTRIRWGRVGQAIS